ncbi:uncharacterized protein LOC119681684 [Teleopsis dalmanni]|uniref:uncharacterized protein LOC119681684 n=1 Tax=Teleopsis dalmanni TaxID=139649 RepID=UPI0018CCDD03|nr:uncharacterized protein LOC119681684 [Teleopsis dalmanni]
MKSLFVILSFAGILISHTVAGNDYTFGTVDSTVELIQTTTVFKPFFPGFVVTKDFVYTQGANTRTIRGIRITDLKMKNGATAELITAIPAAGTTTDVTIRFTSQRSFGIKSIVAVYADP